MKELESAQKPWLRILLISIMIVSGNMLLIISLSAAGLIIGAITVGIIIGYRNQKRVDLPVNNKSFIFIAVLLMIVLAIYLIDLINYHPVNIEAMLGLEEINTEEIYYSIGLISYTVFYFISYAVGYLKGKLKNGKVVQNDN